MEKKALLPEQGQWDFNPKTPFARSVVVGEQVFISGQQALDGDGNVLDANQIAAQTRSVFENMKQSLASAGLGLGDLVRLNTYYVYDGPDEGATHYWEEMTRVRLEYFPNPGPAATAVRIKGMPYPGQLIQIEGIAVSGEARQRRQRIMPDGSWDWSIAVPLSQGWRVGNHVFVGGQISADESGMSVHVGDLDGQTRNIYRFIGNVLKDAGASFDDVVHIKICYKHDSRDPRGQRFVDRIMEITREYVPNPGPVVTAFGVDLLYPGLDLEIDAMAIVDPERKFLVPPALRGAYQNDAFPPGVEAGGEIYVGGQTAETGRDGESGTVDYEGQVREVYEKIRRVLAEGNGMLEDVVKLNLFIVSEDKDIAERFHTAARIWAEVAPRASPAMTPVRVHELARPEFLFQAECIAVR